MITKSTIQDFEYALAKAPEALKPRAYLYANENLSKAVYYLEVFTELYAESEALNVEAKELGDLTQFAQRWSEDLQKRNYILASRVGNSIRNFF